MNTETLRLLVEKGLSAEDILAIAETLDAPKGRNANAERQARYRARRKEESVTRNVTDNALRNGVTPSLSLPPNENNSNPPTHTHPDNKPARKGKSETPAKPDGVTDQVWDDFLDLRKRKRAPLTETALAGICREAEKAGWTLNAALAESVTRGWQAFKAEWVKDAPKPPGEAPRSEYLQHLLAKQNPRLKQGNEG